MTHAHPPATAGQSPSTNDPAEIVRRCTFDLSLDCGHVVTVDVEGWYPVSVACCDRLGGVIVAGVYQPFASHVDYVKVLAERYQQQLAGRPREPARLVARRPRTDGPRPAHPWAEPSAGRFPARVGATWQISAAPPLTGEA